MNRILITCALPYANGPLHFGHLAGACLPADVHARFQRFMGRDVLFVSGSDEFGVAITMSAELEGRTPQQQADHYHAINRGLFDRLGFSFDHFSRTTCKLHAGPVEEFFQSLRRNGWIEQRLSDQLYSQKEGRFLSDRYVVGTCPTCGFERARGDECTRCGASYEAIELINPRSKITDVPLTRKSTLHWYLRLDQFRDRLTDWLSGKKWKPNVLHFAASYARELNPRSITRDASWGIAVPKVEGEVETGQSKVFYVWFDAPIGYISASMEWAEQMGESDRWKSYWLDDKTHLVQFMGKDNIPFHAAIFPAMTMGQNRPYKLVDDLIANEFYHLEGRKLSKSEGWSVDLEGFLDRYSQDQLRYYLAATAPETADSEFTWVDFYTRCNSELVGKFGNFANRVLSFLQVQLKGRVPQAHLMERDRAALERSSHLLAQIQLAYSGYRLRQVTQLIMELAQWGNVYFDSQKPWQAAREGSQERLEAALYTCLEMIRQLAIASFPLMPTTAENLWAQLGYTVPLRSSAWSEICPKALLPGQICHPPQLLFAKLEEAHMREEQRALEKSARSREATASAPDEWRPPPVKAAIDYEHFRSFDLRVGQIVGARRIEKSNKLLCLQVDLGAESRQIVAGLAKYFAPEQLLERKVVVAANLKTANIFGVESQGMVMCAQNGSELELLDPGPARNGSEIC